MNAIAERWIGGCRRELLDRTLVWNQDHLRRILHQYETHHNLRRPHRSLHAAAPLKPLPQPAGLDQYRIRKRACAGGLINEYRLAHDVDEVFGTHRTCTHLVHTAAARTIVRSSGPLAGSNTQT